MKKLLVLLLASGMVFAFAACGTAQESDGNVSTSEQSQTSQAPEIAEPKDSLEVMNTIWNTYKEEEKFPVSGGDSENAVMNAPGAFALTNAEAMDSFLGFPEASLSKIDDAASLVHMMNANTFTGAVYHVANADDVSVVAEALEKNIMSRQWVCGFPEKLLIMNEGNYLITAFGNGELMDAFQVKAAEAYPNASVLCEKPIA